MFKSKPDIVIDRADHERLSQLANGLVEKIPEMADELLTELERARVVDASDLPAGTVQMGSMVEYQVEDGKSRKVTLVYPAEANIDMERVSILTPIGTALLGLGIGQSIDWVANDGRSRRLTVVSVEAAG